MWHPKLRGYMYEIVEMYPTDNGDSGVKHLHVYDNLEDAEVVMAALESVNMNFTCYAMMMRPVWEDEWLRREEKRAACDHNGSTTTTTTNGLVIFDCPKCGQHTEFKYGWDGNGSPSL